MTTPSSPVLQLKSLDFSYPDTPEILRHLDISIHTSERVGLIGPNGAGKSTLFLLINGVLQPSAGEVLSHGRELFKGRFNPQIGLVFQCSDDQLFCPSVYEDVAFGPQNMGLDKEEVTRRVEEALQRVGAEKLAQRPVNHLSEGEKRLVAIAGVLAMSPQLILYDEPSSGLDIRTRRRLIPILKESAPTILIASHDLELILEVCTRVLLLDEGRIVADGPPAQIMNDEVLMNAHGQERPHSLVPHQFLHPH
jgi:cobalt/nickel transport system ATP-binding protein